MHTAKQLNASLFDIDIDGRRVDINALLPDWHFHDRFGIVVTEPLGSLGASLLIQSTITAFYDFRRAHRKIAAVYPEIYLFHVGGHWGDHSTLDFWPPRKEVFVTDDPREVLMAINDRGITRLAVTGEPAAMAHVDWQDNGKERTTAKERMTSIFCYGADGVVSGADVRISATSPVTEENISAILDPASILVDSGRGEAYGDPVMRQYLGVVRTRMGEVAAPARATIADRRRQRIEGGGLSESFRRIGFNEASRLLTASPRSHYPALLARPGGLTPIAEPSARAHAVNAKG